MKENIWRIILYHFIYLIVSSWTFSFIISYCSFIEPRLNINELLSKMIWSISQLPQAFACDPSLWLVCMIWNGWFQHILKLQKFLLFTIFNSCFRLLKFFQSNFAAIMLSLKFNNSNFAAAIWILNLKIFHSTIPGLFPTIYVVYFDSDQVLCWSK